MSEEHETEYDPDLLIQKGRVSVLKQFDSMCQADAMIGFTDEEWKAIKKFFAWNKQVSKWDE